MAIGRASVGEGAPSGAGRARVSSREVIVIVQVVRHGEGGGASCVHRLICARVVLISRAGGGLPALAREGVAHFVWRRPPYE
jgi:hypothetical protein